MTAADTTLLTRQREMMLQKLDEFERTNKALRRLLREQQATEVLKQLCVIMPIVFADLQSLQSCHPCLLHVTRFCFS